MSAGGPLGGDVVLRVGPPWWGQCPYIKRLQWGDTSRVVKYLLQGSQHWLAWTEYSQLCRLPFSKCKLHRALPLLCSHCISGTDCHSEKCILLHHPFPFVMGWWRLERRMLTHQPHLQLDNYPCGPTQSHEVSDVWWLFLGKLAIRHYGTDVRGPCFSTPFLLLKAWIQCLELQKLLGKHQKKQSVIQMCWTHDRSH